MTAIEVADIGDLDLEIEGEALAGWFTLDEVERYRSISSATRKRQFLAGHYLVRALACRQLGGELADWRYCADARGVRRLVSEHHDPGAFASISHAGNRIAVALSSAPVGIDIESFSKDRDFHAIAKHVFSVEEHTRLESLAGDELKRSFYLHWTLKESIAKQDGSGLKFEVSRKQVAVSVEALPQDLQSWCCRDYVLSLASASPDIVETFGLPAVAEVKRWRVLPSIWPEPIAACNADR